MGMMVMVMVVVGQGSKVSDPLEETLPEENGRLTTCQVLAEECVSRRRLNVVSVRVFDGSDVFVWLQSPQQRCWGRTGGWTLSIG